MFLVLQLHQQCPSEVPCDRAALLPQNSKNKVLCNTLCGLGLCEPRQSLWCSEEPPCAAGDLGAAGELLSTHHLSLAEPSTFTHHRIMEYPELEGTRKDIKSSSWPCTGQPQESDLVPENIVQMLLGHLLVQACCCGTKEVVVEGPGRCPGLRIWEFPPWPPGSV